MKILELDDLVSAVAELRARGKRIVHCHGVFDLLHVGHIRHFQAARELGDVLVVTLTPDRFVDKGPHRPAFTAALRAEAIAALGCVDLVAVNRWPTAVEVIGRLRPSCFVKGAQPGEGKRDFTGAIEREEEAVKAVGGRLVLTEGDTFSSTELINRFVDVFTPEVRAFLTEFKRLHSAAEVVRRLRELSSLRVLVVGEAVLAIANQLAGFCGKVTVVTSAGAQDPPADLLGSRMAPNVELALLRRAGRPTLVKRRFLGGHPGTRLFEVFVSEDDPLPADEAAAFRELLAPRLADHDLVVVADCGPGLLDAETVGLLCERAPFLALGVQTSAGSQGPGLVSKYPRADFVALDEPAARLEVCDPRLDLEVVAARVAKRLSARKLLVTRGREGCLLFDAEAGPIRIPAFGNRQEDEVGAQDAALALAAPCAFKGYPAEVVGLVGGVARAEACGIMGPEKPLATPGFFRHVDSLLK